MKILITTGIFPPDIGGPATYVPFIAQWLAERGHQICVLTLSKDLKDNKNYPFKIVKIKRGLPILFRMPLAIFRIVILARQTDIIFANGLWFEAAVANLFLYKPLVNKIVGDRAWEISTRQGWTTDGFGKFQQTRYSFKIEFLKSLRNFYVRRASLNIVPSKYLERTVLNWGVPDNKIKIIYNMVSTIDRIPKIDNPINTKYKIITVGRLLKNKGIDELLEIIGELKDTGLTIIGEGPQKKILENRTQELRVEKLVLFTGAQPQQQVMSYMAACDIFILNSRHEGFPHVILEAMQCGIPVIASNVGGIPEIIKDGINGLIINPGDKEGIKEKITLLLKDSQLRQQLVSNAKETLGFFSKMPEDTEEALQDIIKNECINVGLR